MSELNNTQFRVQGRINLSILLEQKSYFSCITIKNNVSLVCKPLAFLWVNMNIDRLLQDSILRCTPPVKENILRVGLTGFAAPGVSKPSGTVQPTIHLFRLL